MRDTAVMRRIAALLCCLSIALAGCSGSSETTVSGNLRIALVPTASLLPVVAAENFGIFKRLGLHVERTESQDLPTMMAGLSKGSYDLAQTVPTLVFVGAEKGLDLKVVCSMQRSTAEKPNAVWISKDPELDDIAELRGKSVGVPALTGVLTDSLLYLMQRAGLSRDDVNLVPLPFPTMGDQLSAGRVDAVIAPIPFASELTRRGFIAHGDVVVDAVTAASNGTVTTAFTALFSTNGDFAKREPQAIGKWREALDQAIDYLEKNPDQARQLLQSWLKMPAAVAARAQLPSWTTAITEADLAPYLTISKAVGTVHGNLDIANVMWRAP